MAPPPTRAGSLAVLRAEHARRRLALSPETTLSTWDGKPLPVIDAANGLWDEHFAAARRDRAGDREEGEGDDAG